MLLSERFPLRATSWKLRTKTILFDRIPSLMGIVNVTPDSFSDGGRYFDSRRAIEHGLALAEDGAAILDIGGESTRPNADPVDELEEIRRVTGVVQGLAEATSTPISVDTSKSRVAAEAIAAGAEIINDVTGLESDPRMVQVAVETGVGVCAMHMRGNPKTMLNSEFLEYEDVATDVLNYLISRLEKLVELGIAQHRICLDPGIGFAKSHQQNLTLLAAIGRYHATGAPLLVGHSRKGFLAKLLGDKSIDRTHATVGVAMLLAAQGVQVIRVHDVSAVRQALLSFAACGGIDGRELELE